MNPAMMTAAELAYTEMDLTAVINAQEAMAREGHPVAKLSEYWDDLYAVRAEILRRRAVAA